MLTTRDATFFIFLGSLAVIAGAWAFQFAGYEPCHLCLLQRWPYYAAIAIAALTLLFLNGRENLAVKLLGLIMIGSAIFGAYHAGVEWKFWPGPSTCTGNAVSEGLPDLTKPVVLCDDAALRIFGLSLAGWNAIASAAFAAIAFRARGTNP